MSKLHCIVSVYVYHLYIDLWLLCLLLRKV